MMTSLYRLFDADSRLLYVGIAGNPGRRFQQHAAEKQWWGEVGHVALEHFATREAALTAEARAIATERPRYNVVHNQAQPKSEKVHDIEVRCSRCGKQISDGDGYIDSDQEELLRVERATRAWEEEHPGPFLSGGDLLDLPGPAQWRAWHRRCDPQPDASSYWFDVGRFRTYADVLDWTSHLMGKTWLKHTNWDDVVRSLAVTGVFCNRAPLEQMPETCGYWWEDWLGCSAHECTRRTGHLEKHQCDCGINKSLEIGHVEIP